MIKRYKPGDKVLGNWTLTRLIGEGSYGYVYEAERVDYNQVYKAAIKIITIPQSHEEIKNAQLEGMSYHSISESFRTMVKGVVQEFALMSQLKGTANIVSYEDHAVVEHTGKIGWDIIIRMELLTPLLSYFNRREYNAQTVIKLGIDMCKALELCQRQHVIHRDIKPENIFVSAIGDFKLGDFGLARRLEKSRSGYHTKVGTHSYIAPEVERGMAYNSTVDIYSLGIVLYRFLNNYRIPFLPNPPSPIGNGDRERAQHMRLSGAQLPPPMYATGKLAEIVLKSCAFDPRVRYQSPTQMRQELEAVLYNRAEPQHMHTMVGREPSLPNRMMPGHTVPPTSNIVKNNTVTEAKPAFGNSQEYSRLGSNRYPKPPPKKNKWYMYAAALIPLVVVIFILFLVNRNGDGGQGSDGHVSDWGQGSYANAPGSDYQPEYIYIRGVWYHTSEPRLGIIRGGQVLTNDDIAPLRFMTNLTKLYLIGDINITDLSPLSGLNSLTVLQLGHYNTLSNLMPLSNLTNLVELYLNGNAIHDLTPLVRLVNLRHLSLQNNQIFDIAPLAHLTGLEYLNLSNNQIRDITALANLPASVRLNLTGNPIEDWSAVGHIETVYGRP